MAHQAGRRNTRYPYLLSARRAAARLAYRMDISFLFFAWHALRAAVYAVAAAAKLRRLK